MNPPSESRNQCTRSKFMSGGGGGLAAMVPLTFVSLMASWMLISSATYLRRCSCHFIRNKLPYYRFMQGNDPKHTSRRAQAFFEEENINWWRTPPESPDLNPIEDLWHELKFYLESKVKPCNKQELVDGIKKFWERKVTPEKCAKYIDHVLH